MKQGPILYRIFRPIIKLFIRIFFRPKYIGLENIPKKGRIVLGGNHTSYLDCLLLISSTKRTIHFLAKDSLIKGMKGIIFKRMGLIAVNRKIHDKEALRKAIDTLNNDQVIGIFPEGTISKDGELLSFKIGCVKMASETNSMVVPFVISGKYKLFGHGVAIEFLKPIRINKKDLDIENENLRMMIINKIKEKRNKIELT